MTAKSRESLQTGRRKLCVSSSFTVSAREAREYVSSDTCGDGCCVSSEQAYCCIVSSQHAARDIEVFAGQGALEGSAPSGGRCTPLQRRERTGEKTDSIEWNVDRLYKKSVSNWCDIWIR